MDGSKSGGNLPPEDIRITRVELSPSLVISIPPLNALIHGTHVITGHAMGAMIGIDGMVLFAAFCWLIKDMKSGPESKLTIFEASYLRRLVIGLNVGVALLVVWLTFEGTITGIWRYDELAAPDWLSTIQNYLLFFFGLIAVWYLAQLLIVWLRLIFTGHPLALLYQPPSDET